MKLSDYHANLPYSYSGKNIVYKAYPKISRKLLDKKLAESDVYSKFKRFKKIRTSPIYVYRKRELFQADLAFFTEPEYIKANNGMRYLLVIIDCFTKYIWLYPLKDKKCQSVSDKFKDLFNEIDELPKKIQTDKGSEFLCPQVRKLFDEYNIFHYITNSDRKASIAERVIQTIKNLLYKMMDNSEDLNWVYHLPDVRKKYLSSYHRTIKMTPTEGELDINQFELRSEAHKRYGRHKIEKKRKFKVGDKVRIAGYRTVFKRSFWQDYTDEHFIIYKVKSTPLPKSQYYLKDLKGNILKGDPAFFENELSLFIPTKDTLYKIDKILKERNINGKTQYLVTWVGWPKDFTDWVDSDNITNI